MNASIAQSRRSPSSWFSTLVWLAAFISPAASFLLLIVANALQIPNLPAPLVWSMIFVVPAAALFVCGSVAWSCSRTVGRKIGWMLFTLLAMFFQLGILLVR